MKHKILFTGGGTAGHVTLNLSLIPYFLTKNWEVHYIGTMDGIEREMVSKIPDVEYHAITTGKLRRYFDWNNFRDPFRVINGTLQAYKLVKKIKPEIVFSKGGFVSVPVVFATWVNKIPIIIHESDLTPGLANKISALVANKICITFPETRIYFNDSKVIHVEPIVREELKAGSEIKGKKICGFTREKPVLLIMCGSLGSQKINKAIRDNIDILLLYFNVVHICGKGEVNLSFSRDNYKQFEFLNEELPDILAMSSVVISRAGSNSIFELAYLSKPMLLIPLSKESSRGDQIQNAQYFERLGYCTVFEEVNLGTPKFIEAIISVYNDRDKYIKKLSKNFKDNSLNKLILTITETAFRK